MRIQINGTTQDCTAENVAELVRSRKIPEMSLVVELNRRIVRQEDWATTNLKENDEIELLQFVGGG